MESEPRSDEASRTADLFLRDDAPGEVPETPEFFREKWIRLSKAARLLPTLRRAKSGNGTESPPHPSTLVRWWRVGLKSRSGKTVRLVVRKVGSANCTTLKALASFFEELDDLEPTDTPSAHVKTALEKQAEQAVKILRQRGLLE